MRELKRNEKALEGIPFQLLIISVILAITVPTVYSAMEYYDTKRVLDNLKSNIKLIGEKTEQVFIHGTGNSEIIEVDFKDGMFERVDVVKLCGDPNYVIRWNTLEYEGIYEIPKRVPLYNQSGVKSLSSGMHKLRLTCRFGNPDDPDNSGNYFGQNTQYVEVEVIY